MAIDPSSLIAQLLQQPNQQPEPQMTGGSPEDYVGQQLAMLKRPSPIEGRLPPGESSGGGGNYAGHAQELENYVSQWAKGNMTARDVQRAAKDRGWSIDLRRGSTDVEAFDPTGKAHYLTP